MNDTTIFMCLYFVPVLICLIGCWIDQIVDKDDFCVGTWVFYALMPVLNIFISLFIVGSVFVFTVSTIFALPTIIIVALKDTE